MPERPLASSTQPISSRLAWQVGVTTIARLFLNVARRFIYPFAPAFSRALGVPLPAITSLIAINQATGLLGPLFGPLSDRWGYRTMMLVGLGALTVGMLAAGLIPLYPALLLGLFLAGLGKVIYDPALQAYMGERVPFRLRGRVIGLIEMSWAGSSLLGIPLVGLLMAWWWRAPFFVLAASSLASIVALALLISPSRDQMHRATHVHSLSAGWRLLARRREAVGILSYGFCLALANDNLFVIYGAWLERDFGLGLVELGLATTIIGLAELTGEGLTAAFADRLGLKRTISGGLGVLILSYLILPLLPQSLAWALGGLFLVFLSFEVTIVTAFSLTTELLPEARATLLASTQALHGLGRMAGALLGGIIWVSGGLGEISLVSTVVSGLAMLAFVWGLHDWQPDLHRLVEE